MCGQQKLQRGVHASNSMVVIGAREPVSNPVSGGYSIYDPCRYLANREILHKIRKRVKGKVFSAAIIMIISEKAQ